MPSPIPRPAAWSWPAGQLPTANHVLRLRRPVLCQWPTFERVDGVTLAFTAPTVQAAVRMLNCCSAMAFMLK